MLAIVVRTLLFSLTIWQVKGMRKMQELRPDLEEIRPELRYDGQKQQ